MEAKNPTTIVLTGGGTAGHCMPNFYLLSELKKIFDNIYYIGSENSIEKTLCEKYQLPFFEIPTVKLERGKIFSNLKIPFVLLKSIAASKKILKKLKPNVIFSKGGFVSLPVCIAAKQLKIPIVSHESDISFGIANKWILKLCNYMCVNYPELADDKKIIYSGPVFDKDFMRKRDTTDLVFNNNKKTLLIMGGSSGSIFINNFVKVNLHLIKQKYNIIHIYGKNTISIPKNSKDYITFEYHYDMPLLYQAADIVVSRAGANSIFESLFFNKPMLLIPLQNSSSRGDQLQNAQYFEKKQVVKVLPQCSLTPTVFLDNINDILNHYNQFQQKIKQLNLTNGSKIILDLIVKVKK